MSIFDDLNRACVDVFSEGELLTYNHVGGFVQTIMGVFVDRIDEPASPGPITQVSIVSNDLAQDPSKKDGVVRENGKAYVVTEVKVDNAGMTHLQLRQHG